MKKTGLLLFLIILSCKLFAQGTLSGDLMLNAKFFQPDTSIGAGNNPLYDNYLSGGEAWLGLRYNYKGFTAFLRVDAFHNSNLYNPTTAMSGFGLGAWSLSKEYKGLTVTAGYIYDQIGSGILFRSYEDRGLLLDNALVGLSLKYKVTDNITVKGFTGQQKNVANFSRYNPIIKGFDAEGDFGLGGNVRLAPGVGILNRTLDQGSMDAVVSAINSQDVTTRFVPMYNMYAFTGYNTLTIGDFSWYAEGAYKTHEAIVNASNLLVDKPGSVLYSTLSYARKGLAINFAGKRTENFIMRTSPNEVLIRGLLNWQPTIAHVRTQRLISRYTPPSQDLSEAAVSGDLIVNPNDDWSFTLTGIYINTLTGVKLYREGYFEGEWHGNTPWIINAGVQYLQYNQELYQVKPGVPLIVAVTPFAEISYRINTHHSLRLEAQYMNTKQDYGSWVYGLLEYDIAPHFSLAASDMYNYGPTPGHEANHYYSIFTAYTTGPHRITLAYAKQVDGINCAGGVCRYEPAFSGVKLGITTTF